MEDFRNKFKFLKILSKRHLWFSLGFLATFAPIYVGASKFQLNLVQVEGPSMQPTLNPENAKLNDWVVIRKLSKPEEVKNCQNKIVFAVRKERRLIKRLTKVQENQSEEGLQCWLESDAAPGQTKFYDSNIFGFIGSSSIKGKVVAIVFPLHRLRRFN